MKIVTHTNSYLVMERRVTVLEDSNPHKQSSYRVMERRVTVLEGSNPHKQLPCDAEKGNSP